MRLHSRRARASAMSLISENVTRRGYGGKRAFIPPYRPHGDCGVGEKEILGFEAAARKGERACAKQERNRCLGCPNLQDICICFGCVAGGISDVRFG